MGTPQQQAATAIANLLGRVGRFAVVVGVGGGIAQTSLYTGKDSAGLSFHAHPDHYFGEKHAYHWMSSAWEMRQVVVSIG